MTTNPPPITEAQHVFLFDGITAPDTGAGEMTLDQVTDSVAATISGYSHDARSREQFALAYMLGAVSTKDGYVRWDHDELAAIAKGIERGLQTP